MKYLLMIFILMPIVEMWVLIEVGRQIGALATIALVLLTAVVGITLLRQQGFSTLFRAQQKMHDGQIPAHEMVEGLFLAVGGALLLTPGFLTDAVGFACLVPGLRHLLIVFALKHLRFNIQGFNGNPVNDRAQRNDTIEGEFRREDRD